VKFRAATTEDVDALVDLVCERSPRNEPWLATLPFADTVGDARVRLAEDEAGRVAGFGWSFHRLGAPAGHRNVSCWVRPESEGRGIGGRLYRECVGGVGRAVSSWWTRCYADDHRTLGVLDHWGFEQVQLSITSRIALTGEATAMPPLPDGVTVEMVDDLAPPDREDFEAMLTASQTNPEATSINLVTVEEMRNWADPGEEPVGVLVRVDGSPAAIAYGVLLPELGNGGVGYTGVDPRFRGRGLAKVAKRVLHHRAAQRGIREMLTDNEEGNAGIRRVNAELGYVVEYGACRLAKRL
jgi:GNAT superfamily N-acetyltransferase